MRAGSSSLLRQMTERHGEQGGGKIAGREMDTSEKMKTASCGVPSGQVSSSLSLSLFLVCMGCVCV